MEGSGENWPCDSDLDVGDYVKDLYFDVDDESDHNTRRRNQEFSERLLALSDTIPGLNKRMDNTSILDKASNYVKQLQQRVRELEQVESKSGTSSCTEVKSYYYYEGNDNIIPEIRVRVLHKEVLIIIHCEKQKGIMVKIMSHLENLHLSIVNSSVLPFGKSTLDITIIAQMGDRYKRTIDEVVKSLRLVILTK
ncbi:unnamed protein product [Lupinus luteus]|uniref:BHLH domain-containing protein n=1 Tax=Lupinus luteus TaxID=3873 RepID=A0AAV1WIA0_LUPLU